MNSRLFKYGILVLTAVISNGCEKDVKNVDLPPFEKKLAIASFISPSDSGIFVFVSSNQKLYGDLSIKEETGNLSGTISDGTKEVALDTTANGLFLSHAKMPVQYGMTYYLKVKNDEGLHVEAVSTVPGKRDLELRIDSFSYVSHIEPIHEQPDYIYYTMDFQLSLADYPGEKNFYRMKVISVAYKTDTLSGKQYKYYSDLLLNRDYFSNVSREYFTDSGLDGSKIIFKESIMTYDTNYSYYDSAFMKVYLYNTEESYYLYHTSLDKYRDSENPFTEITPVYSNVTGGLGVFTSYTDDSLICRLK